jgi:glycerol-1-phosphate dehydrogenase [NAD(P)+]
MTLRFDPGDIDQFRKDIRTIPGYPAGEPLPMREMLFESGALFRLPEMLTVAGAKADQPLLVVMDRTPILREGVELKPQVLGLLREAGWQPEAVWLEPDATGQVHTDFKQINSVKAHLMPGVAVLSVGSGTVTDVAKHACFVYEHETAAPSLPFVVYQTANSVSAFTSNMAPTFVEGVKRTLPSRYPDVLICDLETLSGAPREMTVAGVGDLLASFSSYADWWLAYRLGMDSSYSEFAETLMGPVGDIFLENAPGIKAGTLEAMALLAKLISLAGLAMSLSHATAPLSGYEHVTSHVLDLIAEQGQRPLAQHGSQVAMCTLLTTQAYQQFFNEFDPQELQAERCYPGEAEMKAKIEATFAELDPGGHVAAECWADYKLKLEAWHANKETVAQALNDWPAIQARLGALVRTPQLALDIMREIDGPQRFSELAPVPSEAEVKFAFLNAPLIRKRLTLGDILLFVNWDRETLWRQVSKDRY